MMNDTVLIVDDSLTVRMDLQDAFEHAGFLTRGCATLAAARATLVHGDIDVVVLDMLLPDGDGVDLLTEIRGDARWSQMVVLMLSTQSEVDDRVRGLQMGADDYVGKPYDAQHVLARARDLLRARRDVQATSQTEVLVIDDSLTFRERLRDVLSAEGYAVRTAPDGEAGLRDAGMSRPHAVVVDSSLPGIDGATVIRRMRLDVALRGVPCLLMTASDERDAELRALDAGADAFVRKSENLDLLSARLAAALRSASSAKVDETVSLMGPRRLLVVDDSPTYLNELSKTLRDDGFDVVQAHSGEEALALLAVQGVDCILLDLMMPGLGGRETCQRIKSAPVVRDIPLIMMTALDDDGAMLDGLSAGADDYILKSSDFDVLKARVQAQIRRKQFEDENRRIRMELLKAELDAAEAHAARVLAESRAELLSILEQKNLALESANAAKTEFLSTMSHELRTPLNAIIGFSHIMLEGITGALTVQQREFIGHIHEGGQHLLSLINDILDLSKIEAGHIDLELEPIHLDSLLSEALSVVQEKAKAHHIAVSHKDMTQDELFKGDRRRIKQIIYNLLSNAVKFTPDHGTINIEASLVDRQQAETNIPGFRHGVRMSLPQGDFSTYVQISVTDSGIGIALDDMTKLFKPFMQIKNELTRRVEGTGLGLATVLRLAQLHGGTVALSSEEGQGSCFSLWLPWRLETVQPQNGAARARGRSLPLALVIEDDAKAAQLMRVQLEHAGFRVQQVMSAEEALQLAGGITPDLVTLDIRLPGMDGWDFLTRIKDIPTWSHVPVVVVSLAADHEIGLSLGAASVLQKPFGPSEFIQELERLGFKPSNAQDIKVLVVDDDPRAIDLMSAYLHQPGYTVLRAFGGQEGIDLTQRHLPDLVVLDLLMPDVGGLEMVEALKRNVATAQIPIIMVTAKQFTEADRVQLDTHVTSVIGKAEMQRGRFIGEVRRAFHKAQQGLVTS